MSDANRLPPMGWPWDQLADAVLRADDAAKRLHAARVTGDVNARNRAELEREVALADHHAIRDEMARQWLAGLRAAIELEPTALAVLLGDLPPAATVTAALDELEDRVDAVEDAAVELKLNR